MLSAAALLAAAIATAAGPPEGARELPAVRLAGEGRLTWLGLPLYEAQLWVGEGFEAQAFERHPLALALHYRRGFRSADIATRSIKEMRRGGDFDSARADRWRRSLEAALPDVAAGDTVLGLYRPGRGVVFFVNGQRSGEVADPAFAVPFFAIWLGPATSEPALRAALLGNKQ